MVLEDHNQLALRYLADTEKNVKFAEYMLPWMHARLMYLRNEPILNYHSLLGKIAKVADERLDTVARAEARCKPQACAAETSVWIEKIRKRARHAQQLSLNYLVYGVAYDLAGKIENADWLQPAATDARNRLNELVRDKLSMTNGTFPNISEREAARNTVALFDLVLAARKTPLDTGVIRESIAAFEAVIENERSLMNEARRRGEPADAGDLDLDSETHAHLAAAQQLLGD